MALRFDSHLPAAASGVRQPSRKGARPQFHAALAADGALELLIYGDVVDAYTITSMEAWGYATDGLISSLSVKKALDAGGAYSKVRLRINSPGGDAFEGMAIHSLLQSCGKPVEACIDGIAASSASIIAMAADTRVMGRTAMMMIHNAWAACLGNKAAMVKMADTLNAIDESIASAYVDRMNLDLADVQSLMDAESWFSAEACVENGLATAIASTAPEADEIEALAQARQFRMAARFQHVPDQFRASEQCECDCEACQGGNCEGCTNADCDDPNCADCPMQSDAGNDIDSLRIRLQSRARGSATPGVRADEDEIGQLEERARQRSGVSDRANGDEVSRLGCQLRDRPYFSDDAIAADAAWRRNHA